MSNEDSDIENIYRQLKYMIEPQSVAIVGASNKIDKVGGAITRNALESNYPGKIYLVNPHTAEIFGKRVYSHLDEIPEDIDLIEIIVPAAQVPQVMDEAVRKGVKGAVIISAGFAEIGKKDLQDEVVRIAKQGGIRILGPNCFGIINTEIDLDLSFTFSKALRGSVAFISQSGAMCCGTLDWAYKEERGFSKFINLGNKCDIDESDALLYLYRDEQTQIIAMYMEGVTNGRRLFEAMSLVSKKKPIVILKAGITEPGARAALSHTASIAGSTKIVRAALRQSGAIYVDDVEKLFDATQVFTQNIAGGKNVAILSNAGGLGVMTTDWCHRLDLKVPQLPLSTIEELESFLLPIASPLNPVDMTGSADYECYKRVLHVISHTEDIDIIIPIFVSQGLITSDGPARAVVEESRKTEKPMLAFWMGGNSIINGVRILKRGDIPVYHSPEKVARAASILVTYSQITKTNKPVNQ